VIPKFKVLTALDGLVRLRLVEAGRSRWRLEAFWTGRTASAKAWRQPLATGMVCILSVLGAELLGKSERLPCGFSSVEKHTWTHLCGGHVRR
jgi:hypothetical protein